MKATWITELSANEKLLAAAKLAKRSKPRADGCIDWTGPTDPKGYGKTGLNIGGVRRSLKAHRLAWMIDRGALTAGMTIDHLCRNPACLNVEHMEEVTFGENARRAGGRPLKMDGEHRCKAHGRQDGYVQVVKSTGYSRWVCRICRRRRNAKDRAVNGARRAAMKAA